MKATHLALALTAGAIALFASPARSEDDLWSHAINTETNGVWNVMPNRPRPRDVGAAGVPGEHGLRIQAHRGANPWDTQASSPVGGAIAQGDAVMVMIYARAEEAPPTGAVLPAMIQLGQAPYTTALSANLPVTSEWAVHCFKGRASASFGANQSNVNVHLGAADQVIDLGPVFVFNLGPSGDVDSYADCAG